MKNLLNLTLLSFLLMNISMAGERVRYPKSPDLAETPGKLCSNPTAQRYPEQIAYCERDVDTYTKNAIIQKYDSMFGFRITSMDRADFKIDHLIPLCAGGDNGEDNLWPQHKSVYLITDPLEPLVCEKMQQGKLKQADAVKLILEAKTHLELVPSIMKKIRKM